MRFRGFIKHAVHSYVPGRRGWFEYHGARVHFPRGSLIFSMACDQGIYEEELVRLLQSMMADGGAMFDVGANIGLIAIPVLQACPSSRVYSFEPSPNTLPYLEKTQAESPWKDRWEIIPKAAAAMCGEASFSLAVSNMGALDGFRNTQRAGKMREVRVPLTTLDSEWVRLGKPRLSVIKIDIEGAETQALEGARELLAEERPLVFLEWNALNLKAYGVPVERLLCLAKESGYRVLSVPNLVEPRDVRELQLQMVTTESFALLPNR